MRLTLFRRPDTSGQYSYLAVLEGKPIPEEAASTEWELAAASLEVADDNDTLSEFGITHTYAQIRDKAYAITSVNAMRERRQR
jgi:hypothetical protein